MAKDNKAIITEFKKYVTTFYECVADIRFLDSCINQNVGQLKANLPYQDYYSESGFYTYNTGNFSDDRLKGLSESKHSITPSNIEAWHYNLLSNINVINIVKYYNSIERLIITAIKDVYFRDLAIVKPLQKSIDEAIVSLGFKDKSNNKHLIKFISSHSINCRDFLRQKINIDQTITWAAFFNLVSILRNNIAHTGGSINVDIKNKLNGINKPIISLYFLFNDEKLMIKDNMEFLNFFGTCDWFVVNLVKFIYDEKNLKFLGMH